MNRDEANSVPQIWVMTVEAAEMTGYSMGYMTKLAQKLVKQPEHERKIKIRKLANRYLLWLPDLMEYIKERGPYTKDND